MLNSKRSGFTLIEMLVVIIIIGILATLAFPGFMKSRDHAIDKEAVANLKLIAAAQKIYRMETGAYFGPNADAATINSVLKLSLPTDATTRNWNFSIESGTDANNFNLKGARTGGKPCQYTLSQGQDEPAPSSTADCP